MKEPCIRPYHKEPVPSTATVKESMGGVSYMQFRLCTPCANELERMGLSIIRITYDVVETRTSVNRVKGPLAPTDAT